ncbi:GNAT family N-acetyltransferase [uncultured Campylobacter sp.]|uniref:GNAT family N-acetyltransferase n=1 Tax=uncultured Campylobacter sp. TaxID=218934 RepID=UPI00261339CA|nr:GNAT family N-acetyltransferase [uncultured Campylobacter sp.]
MSNIEEKYIKDIDISNPFFDSLRSDYDGFDAWIERKALSGEKAYVLFDDNRIVAFLYLKVENPVDNTNIDPRLDTGHPWLKIGTMKIEAHGTKLGERLIKRVFDFAVSKNIYDVYVTSFAKQTPLIALLKRYGFVEYGKKNEEIVLIKNIPTRRQDIRGDILLDYPAVITTNANKYILGIWPEYHTRMFSDSILKTENYDILRDMSESNSIHKVYITKIYGAEQLRRGDCLIIYRTKDDSASNANYSSVATSLCVVEEYRDLSSFGNVNEFVEYCKPHNIFTNSELERFFEKKTYPKVIKMTYNVSFKKRVILGVLREILGGEPSYWGFVRLTDSGFSNILREGSVDDRIIID